MQIKDKIDFSYLKSPRQAIAKIVLGILKFVIITAIIYLAFYFLSFLRLTSLNAGVPTSVFSIVFAFMVILSIIVCMVGLTKSLFLSSDNQVLLTMPTSRLTLFISKLMVYFVYELKRNITFILPLLIAFSMINEVAIWFYLWLIVAMVIITLFTVSIGALLSIPALLLTFVFRRMKWLQYTLIVVSSTAIVLLLIKVIGLIPENFDLIANWGTIFWEIQDFLQQYMFDFAPLYHLAIAFVGTRYGVTNRLFDSKQLIYFSIIVGIIALVLLLTFLIVRPLFFYMASKPFEYAKKSGVKAKKNKKQKPFLGGLKKETIQTFRSSEKLSTIVITIILLPLLIFLLNKIFAAMDTRLSGAYMAMAFNILLILLIALSSNAIVSKIYSQEGQSAYINKTMPAHQGMILLSKLIIYLVLFNVSIIVATSIFASFNDYSTSMIIISIVTMCSIYSGHLFSSATLDIMNPQTSQYATTGTHANNPNELRSTLSAFGVSAIFAFIFFFLVEEGLMKVWVKLMAISLVYLIWNIYMFFTKIKVYYKEK